MTVLAGGRIVVLGGGDLDAWRGRGDARRHVGYSYDPKTKKTTQLVSERYADGAIYDPDADRWAALPAFPGSARSGAAAFWTGKEVLVWSGSDESGEPRRDGAAYSPTTGRLANHLAMALPRRSRLDRSLDGAGDDRLGWLRPSAGPDADWSGLQPDRRSLAAARLVSTARPPVAHGGVD